MNFGSNINKLVRNIKTQRETISQGYGPLTLHPLTQARPIFEIHQDIDPDGFLKANYLAKKQGEVPGILNINLIECRCLKDKISPGYFILRVKVLSRIGQSPMTYDLNDCFDEYKELSQNLRYYSAKKRKYLDREHREMEVKAEDGTKITKSAVATGLNFFNAGQAKKVGMSVDLDQINEDLK